MERDYAQRRGDILRELDGLRVEVDQTNKIGYLILDRPPLNIVSFKGRAQIRAVIEAFDDDDDVGVIVIKGANGAFTSGGDGKRFPDIPKNQMSDLADNIGAPERCSKPVIAAIEKYAFGVGFELSLACDFRFATSDALVGLPESAIGQMPGSGGSARGVRLIGMTRAKDIVMLGKRVPAKEAKDMGLITDVAENGKALDELIIDYAAKLNALAPISMRSLKRVLNSTLDSPLSVALDMEGHSYETLRWTDDYNEGIKAFSERRKADYKGQ